MHIFSIILISSILSFEVSAFQVRKKDDKRFYGANANNELVKQRLEGCYKKNKCNSFDVYTEILQCKMMCRKQADS